MAEERTTEKSGARFLALLILIGFIVVIWKILAFIFRNVPVVGEMAYLAS
jgi:hypothetical protein